jgi:ribosomal protein L16 Arg81 hydroxylase
VTTPTETPLTTPTATGTRTPTTPSGWALARAIEPVEPERFRSEFWERRPLAVPRDEEGRFDDLLSARDVERLVTETAIRTPAFRLVKAGETVSAYTTDLSWRPEPFSGTARVGRVLEEFERGATIVLQALHHSWLPLARYCRDLEATFGHSAQANAYYTPRGSQGLPVHHDTHEVITLQVAGEKRWLVYEPALELPLKRQRYSAALGDPGEPVLDVVARAGDTLYLPRGWLHEAVTAESDSLHITVGVNVRPWIEAVREALDELESELPYRRSIDEEPDGLLESLAARLDPEDVRRRARQRLVRSRRPILDGQLAELRALDSLTVETPLERRATVLADLEETTLVFEGKRLGFPERLRPELEFLVAVDGPFTATDLPGSLDDAGLLVLVRRLVREGFLRRSAAGA